MYSYSGIVPKNAFICKDSFFLIQRYFFAVFLLTGKTDLSEGYWNPKRKLLLIRNFFRDKIQGNVWHFPILKINYFRKMRGYPNFLFGFQ